MPLTCSANHRLLLFFNLSAILYLVLSAQPAIAQAPSFSPAITYDSGGYQASSVAVADVNGDGIPDLIVTNCGGCYGPPSIRHTGSVAVLLGNGDGTFRTAATYFSGGLVPIFVAIGDLNLDGRPDLAIANRNSQSVGVLLGNGDGTFQPALAFSAGGLTGPQAVSIADMNRDSKPDLIVASPCADAGCHGSVGVLLGNGDGTFHAALHYSAGGLYAQSVAVADLNRDGSPDALVVTDVTVCKGGSCYFPSGVGVLLGNGDATFQTSVTYPSGGDAIPPLSSLLAVSDVNGDGNPDVIVQNTECCASEGKVSGAIVGVLLGNGDGTFQPAMTYKTGSGHDSATSVAIADMNLDGKLDIAVTDPCEAVDCHNSGLIAILLGNGDGTFHEPQTFGTHGFLTNSVAIADLNKDGKPDLVVANLCEDDTSYCSQASVGVLLNNTAVCTASPVVTASTTPKSLWPPNGKLVPVTVSGTITDIGCAITAATYTVKDEYGRVLPSGPVTLLPGGTYSFTVWLKAARLGTDLNGRHYTIKVTAGNVAGKTGSRSRTVIVPHDQRH